MRLQTLEGFDEATRRHRWAGETLPVLYQGALLCSRCGYGELLVFPPYVVDALFIFGGYGESTRITAAVCQACGRTAVLRRETVRPPRKDPR